MRAYRVLFDTLAYWWPNSPMFQRILLSFILLSACISASAGEGDWAAKNDIYRTVKSPVPMVIDGVREEAWGRAEARLLGHFHGVELPSDRQDTVFRMLWDEEHIYLLFESQDRYLQSAITERNGPTFMDDCAEFFVIPADAPLDFHLGFEVNLNSVANDFVFITNLSGGQSASVKSYDPDFAVAVVLDGTLNDNSDIDRGWTMEFAIPRALFLGIEKFSPIEPGNRWAFQALRQERNDPEIGRRVWSTLFPLPEGSREVHDPITFGLLEFVE